MERHESRLPPRFWQIIAALCALLALVGGGLFLSGGAGEEASSARQPAGAAATSPAFRRPDGAWACRIDALRVGRKVLAELPESVEVEG